MTSTRYRARHLALVLPDFGGGGAERVALTIIRELRKRGHRVDLLLADCRGDLLPLLPSGVRVIDLASATLRQSLRPLTRYLRRERPHGLLSFMWPLNLYAVLAGKLAGGKTRVVVTDHIALSRQYEGQGRLHDLFLRASIAAIYPRAAARVLVSAGAADDLARLSGLDRASLDVIYNPLEVPDPLPPASAMAEAAWGPGAGLRILTVGRLKKQKNQELLLRAFAALPSEPPARLMLLGEGPLREELREKAAALRIADRVIFAGFHADPWPFYASADLFVLSSDYEGFANVVAEALRAGLPVVSTDCPHGPAEILEGGRLGTLVPVADQQALTAALAWAVAGKLARPDLRREWLDRFDKEAAIDRYEQLLVGEAR